MAENTIKDYRENRKELTKLPKHTITLFIFSLIPFKWKHRNIFICLLSWFRHKSQHFFWLFRSKKQGKRAKIPGFNMPRRIEKLKSFNWEICRNYRRELREKSSKQVFSAAVFAMIFVVLLLAFLATLVFAANTVTEVRSFVVGAFICEVTSSCQGGWIDMFHLSNETNAHAELANNSDYSNYVCCVSNDTAITSIGNTCTEKYWVMLHLSNDTNAHVELNNNSAYSIRTCLTLNSTNYVINWSYRTNCSGYGECVVSVSNDTNAHVSACGDSEFSTKLCADLIEDTTIPTITLLTPGNNTNLTGATVEFNYTVDDDNNIVNCSLIANGSVLETDTSIEKQVNQTFRFTLTQGLFSWTVNCTDSSNNRATAPIRELAVQGMGCEVATSCSAGYSELFHMNSTKNAHAELVNRSDFAYKVCCKTNVGAGITANCSTAFGSVWTMLHLAFENNSHVELNNNSNYNIDACLNLNSTSYMLSCSYKPSCTNAEACIATVNQETNSHVAHCDENAYGTRLCCQIEPDTTSPTVTLVNPVNGSTWDGDTTATVTFTYNVSDANNIANCSLYIDTVRDQTDSTITKDTNQSFLKSFGLGGNRTWYVRCTDAAVNVAPVIPSWQLNFSRAVPPEASTITFVFPTPDDNARQIRNWIYVNVTVNTTDNNVSTCFLEWDDGVSKANETMNRIGNGTSVTCWQNKTTTDGDTYNYRVYANETSDTWGVSEQRTNIENSLATNVSLVYNADGATTTNRTPQFNWTAAVDNESDTLIYELNITCFPSCSDDNQRVNSSGNENWKTITSRLRYFFDDSYYYNWTVSVWDGYERTEYNETPFTLKLSSSVTLSMINASISLGTFTGFGQVINTTNASLIPLTLENAGNCFVDVNLSISQADWLWDTQQAASSYYRYKIDNLTGEEGAFNWSGSQINWSDVPLSNVTVIDFFNYTDATDVAEIDILAELPTGEGWGNKNSHLAFIGWYVREL